MPPSTEALAMPSTGICPAKVICKPCQKLGLMPDCSGSAPTHCVITTGKEISKATRATMAGLKGLQPRPPNTCLASTMAIKLPSTPTHHGVHGGSVSAKSQPVTSAERSNSFWRTDLRASQIEAASQLAAEAVVTSHSQKAGQPKFQKASSVAGRSASITLCMISPMEPQAWACGA